jgi:Protein of unknown function (DUF2380)
LPDRLEVGRVEARSLDSSDMSDRGVRRQDGFVTARAGENAEAIAARARHWGRRPRSEALLPRARALLAAFGIAALLSAISIAVGHGSNSALAASDQVKTVALLGAQFLNDHADLEPTTEAERARLASVKALFKSKLEASGRYEFVRVPADVAAKIAAGPQIGNCGGCEFDYAKQLGAEFAAWIVVQKVSDLILNINVYMADVAARKLTFVHSVDIRGNTDESWARGITYLVKNYLLPNPL